MRWTVLLALVLVAPAMTGCIGLGDDDSQGEGLQTESQARFTSDTGGIEGIVTDEAIQPVEEATILIAELGEETTTRADGSFAFSEVTPGTYTLEITADGFLGTEKTVEVSSGDVATAEIVLAHEPSVEPFSQQFEYKGFLECSAAVSDAVVDAVAQTPAPAYGAVAVCGIPNSLLGGNATNDRFLFTQQVEANPWQMVTELTWEPGTPLTQEMSLNVEAEGFSNNNSATFAQDAGPNPLILRTDRETIAGVVGNLSEACVGGDDGACNRNYVEDGGPLQLRTFVDATELEPGIAVQQDYTLFMSVFYNTPACESYSIVEDDQCDQLDEPPASDPYEDGSNEGGA